MKFLNLDEEKIPKILIASECLNGGPLRAVLGLPVFLGYSSPLIISPPPLSSGRSVRKFMSKSLNFFKQKHLTAVTFSSGQIWNPSILGRQFEPCR